jgi:hypothetical protein
VNLDHPEEVDPLVQVATPVILDLVDQVDQVDPQVQLVLVAILDPLVNLDHLEEVVLVDPQE